MATEATTTTTSATPATTGVAPVAGLGADRLVELALLLDDGAVQPPDRTPRQRERAPWSPGTRRRRTRRRRTRPGRAPGRPPVGMPAAVPTDHDREPHGDRAGEDDRPGGASRIRPATRALRPRSAARLKTLEPRITPTPMVRCPRTSAVVAEVISGALAASAASDAEHRLGQARGARPRVRAGRPGARWPRGSPARPAAKTRVVEARRRCRWRSSPNGHAGPSRERTTCRPAFPALRNEV